MYKVDTTFYRRRQFPFLVTGLPRSMSCWASAYLSTGPSVCLHEPEMSGTIPSYSFAAASSGVIEFYDDVNKDIPIAVILRDRDSAACSFMRYLRNSMELDKQKINLIKTHFIKMDEKIDRILSTNMESAAFSFDMLKSGSNAEAVRLYNFCYSRFNVVANPQLTEQFLNMNIQVKPLNYTKGAE